MTVSKNFNISRFPLGGNVLKFYIEPNEYTIDEVVFVPDVENSGMNKNLSITSYSLVRNAVSENVISYPNTMNNPRFENPRVTSEIATVIEIQRTDWGLYLKCFIALIGTLTWVFITLYLCTFHNIDPLSMIPAALFGTVTNIMVGANLLPDALQVGLLEYVTLAGIMAILACSISVVNINRIRTKMKDSRFAYIFGQTMFFTILGLTLLAAVLYPVCAYMF